MDRGYWKGRNIVIVREDKDCGLIRSGAAAENVIQDSDYGMTLLEQTDGKVIEYLIFLVNLPDANMKWSHDDFVFLSG